ncbi:hypothetical protein ACTFIU_001404 [Dictyostelium citrinum]
MSVYCELNDVVQQIRYKTQIFYETFKRDSIAEQIYNFSNESSSEIDPDIPFSKSLDKDYSLLYRPVSISNNNATPGNSTPPNNALSPNHQQQAQNQQQSQQQAQQQAQQQSQQQSQQAQQQAQQQSQQQSQQAQQQAQQQSQQQAQQKPTTATTASTVTTTPQQQPSPNNTTSSCTSSSSGSSSGTTNTTTSNTTTSTNTSTVTSATNSSTISSLTSTNASTSSAYSTDQQKPNQPPQPQNTSQSQNTNNEQQQQSQQQQQQQQQKQQQQTSTSPKKCKIVTFTGTSVKLNSKTLQKPDKTSEKENKQQQPDSSKTQQQTQPQQQQDPQQPVFIFVKEKVNKVNHDSPITPPSLLTRLVKPNSDEAEYGDIIPPPGMGLTLSIHTGNTGVGQLKVRVIEKATIIQTIFAALKLHHHNGGTGLIPDPKAYNLRIADSNGKIDQDFPPLDPNQYITKFKDEVLVLCPNPKFDLKKSTSSLSISGGVPQQQNNNSSVNSNSSNNSSNSNSNNNNNNSNNNNNNNNTNNNSSNNNNSNNNNMKSSTSGFQPQQSQQQQQQQQHPQQVQQQLSSNQLQPDQVGGGGNFHRTHHRNVSSGPDAPLVVKITLPDSSITKVVFQKTMLLKDLLESTCKKRKLLISDHYFTLENGQTCNGTLPMEKLGGADLILVSRRPIEQMTALSPTDTDSTGSSSDLQQEIFWYDALAWQYKTYEVTKTKKYGPKQDRIIGIDRERVTNMSPKDTETKRPARLIKDISKVALLEKPKYFTIEYNDGKSYIYEAKTTSLANEIVGKISYILGK